MNISKRQTLQNMPLPDIQNVKEYVEKYIRALECERFVEKTKDCCVCGRDRQCHILNDNGRTGPWDRKNDLKDVPSKAYGEMKLCGFRALAGFHIKYIRASERTNLNEHLYYIMTKLWGIPKPDLIISINGGAKKMIPLSNEAKSAFKRGLVNVSKAACTWIITGGFNFGVTKLVGEAARDYNIASQEKSFTVLGIGTWGAVYNRKKLINEGQQIIYNNAEGQFTLKGQAPLDPNHDAFILFDSGLEGIFGEEINFRAKFETFLSKTANCSIVQVMVEGGKKCIITADESLTNGIPVLIMKGSKRAADLICDVVESDKTSTNNIIESGLESYKKEWSITNDKEMEDLKTNLKSLKKFRELKLIHIFSMSDFTKNLDRAILEAIFSAKINGRALTNDEKLKLAMTFNRPDVAEECILEFSTSRSEFIDYQKYIKEALIKNQWKFVSLFLSRGTQVKSFLTKNVLRDLYFGAEVHKYLNVSTLNILRYVTRSVSSSKKLSTIGLVIKKLTKNLIANMYQDESSSKSCCCLTNNESTEDEKKFEITNFDKYIEPISEDSSSTKYYYTKHPPRNKDKQSIYTIQDLFLWAILTQRWEMAKIFWENGKDHMGSALVACVICSMMNKIAFKEGEAEMMITLLKYRDEFEDLAINILTEAYWRDKIRTHFLLSRALPYWARLTCMEIANKDQLINFLSHTACQTRLNYIWLGGMSNDINTFYFLLNLPLAFLTSKLIIFQNRKVDEEETDLIVSTQSSLDKASVDKASVDKILNIKKANTIVRDNHTPLSTCQMKRGYLDEFREEQIYLQNFTFCEAVSLYYNAPITKFTMHVFSYMVFLTIYSYMCLVEILPLTSVTMIRQRQMEYAVYTYFASFILEEIRQSMAGSEFGSLKERLKNWISSLWNIFDMIFYIIFILAIILRHITSIDFVYARTLFSAALSMSFLRFLQFYYANRMLGPKVISVTRMIKDILFFLGLWIIAIFAYGTFAQALLFSNSSLDGFLLKNIVYMPYWESYGDLHIDYVEGTVPLNNVNPTPNAMVIVGFVIYILFTNALLMNMLVAMFGITIQKVEDNSNKLWAFNRYQLIEEFYFRPILPPPLNFIEIFIAGFLKIKRHSKHEKILKNNNLVFHLEHEEDLLSAGFEQQCLETYLIDNPLFKSAEDCDQKSKSIKIENEETSFNTANTERNGFTEKWMSSVMETLNELKQEMKNAKEQIDKVRRHQKRNPSMTRANTVMAKNQIKNVLPIDFD